MRSYQNKVISLAGEQQKVEVQLVVNLFQSVLDGFIRGEIKREEAEPVKVIAKKKAKDKLSQHFLFFQSITCFFFLYVAVSLELYVQYRSSDF